MDRKSKLSNDELRQLWGDFEKYNPKGFSELMETSLASQEEVDGESSYTMIPLFLKLEAFPDQNMLDLNKIAFDMWLMLPALQIEQGARKSLNKLS